MVLLGNMYKKKGIVMKLRKATFEEIVKKFNIALSTMEMKQTDKMTLLGIVTAMLQRYDEDIPRVRCRDCKLYDAELEGCYCWCIYGVKPDFYCSWGEKRGS